jgi:NADPH:quinone reductase-like Zn-dependent oxidoreductase
MMKAWELQAFGRENLRLVDKPIPQPGPSDVLLRVNAVSLNYRDKLVVEGQYNPAMTFPITQVADAVGEVVETGKDVTRFKPGDRVITHYTTRWIDGEPQGDESTHTLGNTIQGALAEYLVLHEGALVHAPAYLSDEEAAAIPCAGLTAWYALVEKGQLKANDVVLVQGTGGVSLFGLQIATAMGARVIVTSSSEEKLARVKALGACHGINYVRTPQWEQEVLKHTAQKGAGHILEVAGGKSLSQSMNAIKAGGTISVIGILDGFSSEIPVFQILVKQIVLRGISVGPRRALEDMIRAFESYELSPVIDTVYSFKDAMEAYEHLYRGAFGKIVIRVCE